MNTKAKVDIVGRLYGKCQDGRIYNPTGLAPALLVGNARPRSWSMRGGKC